jgi:hypothetical protein
VLYCREKFRGNVPAVAMIIWFGTVHRLRYLYESWHLIIIEGLTIAAMIDVMPFHGVN